MADEAGTIAPEAPVSAPAAPEFTGKPGNFAADMAALQAELAPAPVAPVVPEAAPVQAEVTPQPEITDKAPATVPEKFKAPDGSLDKAKLDKSAAAADMTLERYLEKERVLRQKMNEVNRLERSVPQSVPAEPAAPPQPQSFAATLEADIAKYGAGAVLEKLFRAAKETAKDEVLGEIQAVRDESAKSKSRRELELIAKHDPVVLTPEGLEALARIREQRPWLNDAPNPTEEAYDVYLAEQAKEARLKGTVLPTPTGLTAKAPPTPVGPAPRAFVQPTGPNLGSMSEAEINAMVAKMTPVQEKAFWASRGLKY